jgi:raffinose/stachyose/melibiose transport system substrate-binding protein
MKRLAFATLLGLAAFAGSANAQTTVTYLNISTGSDKDLMLELADEYMAMHPDVAVDLPTLENEAFKAKLTTLLQSPDAPDIFHSWGGGVFAEQARAGVLRNVDGLLSQDTLDSVGAAGVAAFTAPDGHMYGLARNVQGVMLWYNKSLLDQAGVDPESLSTWDGFLAGVQKLKDAGITPIALGGKDKWPAQFWWGYLIIRNAGHDVFYAAKDGEGDGYVVPDIIKAGDMLHQLAELKPFQEGFEAATYGDAGGFFGDGKAAMHLMGEWDYQVQHESSADGSGIPDEDLGIMPFPSVEGGKGNTGSLGGIEGYLFSRSASDEAIAFLEWYNAKDQQSRFAAADYHIPITAGAADSMENPYKRQIAEMANKSTWHQLFFDQTLGADLGGAFNDFALELAAGDISGQEAAELLQQAAEDAQ